MRVFDENNIGFRAATGLRAVILAGGYELNRPARLFYLERAKKLLPFRCFREHLYGRIRPGFF